MSRLRAYKDRIRQLPPGSSFIRKAKHGGLWRLPNGYTILVSTEPDTGHRADRNFRARLQRLTNP